MNYLRLSATIHKSAKWWALPSDAARAGWIVLLCEARGQGGLFQSEAQLRGAMGIYAKWIPAFRKAGILEGLTIHGWDDWQDVLSDSPAAVRKRRQRDRDKHRDAERDTSHKNAGHVPVTVPVTSVTQQSREEKNGVNPVTPGLLANTSSSPKPAKKGTAEVPFTDNGDRLRPGAEPVHWGELYHELAEERSA